MINREKRKHLDKSDDIATRAAYCQPRLIRYGNIKDLTATGSGRHPENTGQDEANNKLRNLP